MTVWLLVLVFAGSTGHVYAEFKDEAGCKRLAAQLNEQQRAAVCVPWRGQ